MFSRKVKYYNIIIKSKDNKEIKLSLLENKPIQEAIDEFIGLHHLDKAKRIRGPKEAGALYDIEDLMPRDIETLLDMILPDSIDD